MSDSCGEFRYSTQAQKTIAENRVVIFSKSYCPYCSRAKDLFATHLPDVHVKVLECVVVQLSFAWREAEPLLRAVRLDLRDDGPDIQGYLAQLTDQRSVPNVFISEPVPYLCWFGLVLTPTHRYPDQKHVGGERDTSLSAVAY